MFKRPNATRSQKAARRGFTLTEVVVVAAVIGMLATLAAASIMRARSKASASVCIGNLNQISRAKSIWAFEQKMASTATPTDPDLFGAAGYLKFKPVCPMNGTYDIHPVSDNPTCTIPTHELPP